MTRSAQLPQAAVEPTKPRTEEPGGRNSDQSNWECSDDDIDPRFVGLIIRNLSPGGTVQAESDTPDHGARWHGAGNSSLANPTGLLQFLNDYDLLLENTDSDGDDDDIISHMRGCYPAHLIIRMATGKTGGTSPVNPLPTTLTSLMRSLTKPARKAKIAFSTTTTCLRKRTGSSGNRSKSKAWHEAAKSTTISCGQPLHTREPSRTMLSPCVKRRLCRNHQPRKGIRCSEGFKN